MGGMLCCAGSAVCCAASCCCWACSKAGVRESNYSKVGYVFFQAFWMGIALLMMVFAESLVAYVPAGMTDCPKDSEETSDNPSTCLGASAIIRMSFALVISHIVILMVTLARNEMAAAFHDGCWCFKFLFVAGIFTGSMWIPNSFMQGYM